MRKNDWLIIVIVLIIAGGIYAGSRMSRQQEDSSNLQVNVYFDGELQDSCALSDTERFAIDTSYGHNVILVEQGEVRMSEADCPDLLCTQSGGIDSALENIVCLPNRVHVEIVGGEGEAEIDVISE